VWRVILLALQIGLRENKLIEIHEEWLVQRGDGWWLGITWTNTNQGVPKAVPRNNLALESLRGDVPRIGERFFAQWKDGYSFKHRWDGTCERAGIHDLHFHDLRHLERGSCKPASTMSSSKNVRHRLPGTGKLYLYDWDGRLRDAVNRLEEFMLRIFYW
jgi:integrase